MPSGTSRDGIRREISSARWRHRKRRERSEDHLRGDLKQGTRGFRREGKGRETIVSFLLSIQAFYFFLPFDLTRVILGLRPVVPVFVPDIFFFFEGPLIDSIEKILLIEVAFVAVRVLG